MEAVSKNEFLNWAAEKKIGFDLQYPESRRVTFIPIKGHARFWVLPVDPTTWPDFISSLLDSLDEWSAGFLWPRSGDFPESKQSQSSNDWVRDVVLRGAGVPDGWSGAIRFEREEQRAILAVLFAYLLFGWCADDDLFFIPGHGQQLLHTDHHDVIHVECAEEARVLELVQHMNQAGYSLPTEPPDATFKWPSWMTRPSA